MRRAPHHVRAAKKDYVIALLQGGHCEPPQAAKQSPRVHGDCFATLAMTEFVSMFSTEHYVIYFSID
jgi:hypothetical protein